MKITDAFLGEHGILYAQFDYLEGMLRGSPTLEQAHSAAAILTSAMKPHAELEEELLFAPAVERMGHPHAALDVMHEEHEEVKGHVMAARNATRVDVAVEELLRAVDLARYHFLKEEQVTFPLAEQLLGAEELERLGREWAARRAVVLASAD